MVRASARPAPRAIRCKKSTAGPSTTITRNSSWRPSTSRLRTAPCTRTIRTRTCPTSVRTSTSSSTKSSRKTPNNVSRTSCRKRSAIPLRFFSHVALPWGFLFRRRGGGYTRADRPGRTNTTNRTNTTGGTAAGAKKNEEREKGVDTGPGVFVFFVSER